MIKVWTDTAEAGRLDRHGERGAAFAYVPGIPDARSVSMTMPVRLVSWNIPFGLHPIFEMNLPEGALRERLRIAFAKATGRFDDLDLLGIVGRSQIGRIRFTGEREDLREEVPFQSVDELLDRRREGGLFRHLVERFAAYSGISGVQPKFLLRDGDAFGSPGQARLSQSFRGATHIVKFWDARDYPHLAANEWFCLQAAAACGLQVPPCRLAEDGAAIIIDRFDLQEDGTYLGFEDFCVLNGRRTEDKYRGSYETAVLKRLQQFAPGAALNGDLERLFTLIALNCALRNGDAHLKNFGLVYREVGGEARLAPVYDLVTTTAYLPQDGLALTLDGTTRWPGAAQLQKLGEKGLGREPARIRAILQRVDEALAETAEKVKTHMRTDPGFREIGARMLLAWEEGASHSLRGAG